MIAINIDSGYVCRRDEFVFVPGAVEACRILSRAGFKLFVVTNQSGIGRGYYTEEDFLRLTSWMQNEMASDGAPIEKVYLPKLSAIAESAAAASRSPA